MNTNAAPKRDYWPTTDWRSRAPQAVGFKPEPFAAMQTRIQEQLPGLYSLLIVRHGYIAFEEYYQSFHRRSLNSISSATKSIISMLIGATLQQGLIKSIDQPMLDFFPELAEQESDPRKRRVTLRHLLSFQTGFTEEYPPQFWLKIVDSAVKRVMVEEPGQRFFYDNLSVDILSGIISRLTGMKAADYAMQTLFKTLGVWSDPDTRFAWQHEQTAPNEWHADALWDEQDGYPWKVSGQGTSTGSFGAHFTARDMAKLGFLYLNKGTWDGQQLLPQDFVAASTHQQSDGGAPVYAQYGYLWWIEEASGHHASFASGYGGKHIYIIPELDLLIVTTASTEQARKDPEQHNKIRTLIPNFIIPALA